MPAEKKKSTKAKKVALPKTITVAALKSVKNMAGVKLAMVALFDDRVKEVAEKLGVSEKRITEVGKFAIALCADGCYFCTSDTAVKPNFPSKEAVLCGCLASYRSGYREVTPWKKPMQDAAVRLQSVPKEKQREARQQERNKLLTLFGGKATILFTDKCVVSSCRQPFEVTADFATKALLGYGKYLQSSKCPACREAARKERQEKKALDAGERQPTPAEVAVAAQTTTEKNLGVKPRRGNKRAMTIERPLTLEESKETSLAVSMGEIMAAKKAEA